eukprot:scaffold1.g5485.t1
MALSVGKARKKYGVPFPNLYAPQGHEKEKEFNCVQRGHQNSLENLPTFLSLLAVAGYRFPIPAAVCAAVYLAGRVRYFQGYSTGDPKARYKGGFNHLGMIGLLGLAATYSVELLAAWWNAAELLELVAASSSEFTPITAANSLTKFSKLLRGAPPAERQSVRRHPALAELLAHIEASMDGFAPRDICAVLQGCAWLQLAAPGSLLEGLSLRLAAQARNAAPPDVVQSLWALAKLGFTSQALLAAVEQLAVCPEPVACTTAGATGAGASDSAGGNSGSSPVGGQSAELSWLAHLPPSQLSILAWACAKLGNRSAPLLSAVAAELAAPGRAAGLSAGELSIALYAFGSLGWHPGPRVLGGLAALARRCLPELTAQGLAQCAFGLSKLSHRDPPLMAALAAEAARRADEFRPTELTMLLAAYSRLRLPEPALAAAAAARLQALAPTCTARDLADVLSSLATLGYRPPLAVLAAAAARAAALAPSYPPVWLSWLLYAFARMGYRPVALMAALERVCRADSLRLREFEPVELGRVLWAMGSMRHYSGGLLDALALALRDAVPAMPPQSLALALHAYASQRHTPHEVLDAAAEHMAARLEDYPPQATAMMLWSFAKLGVHPGRGLPGGGPTTPGGAPLMAAVADTVQRRHAEFSIQGLSMVLWSFATLEDLPPEGLLDAVSARLQTALAWQQQQRDWHAVPTEPAAEARWEERQPEEQVLMEQQQRWEEQQLEHSAAATGSSEAVGLQAAANIAWSFARFKREDAGLFATIGAAAPALLRPLADWPVSEAEDEEVEWGALMGEEGSLLPDSLPPPAGAGAEAAEEDEGPEAEEGLAEEEEEEGVPQAISNLAYAAAKLGVRDTGLMAALRRAAAPRLPLFHPDELANLLWAFSALDCCPLPPAFLAAACAQLEATLPACDPALCCLAVHALGSMRYAAGGGLLGSAAAHVAAAADSVPHGLACKLLHGFAAIGYQPSPASLDAICNALYYRLSHARARITVLPASDAILLAWALAVLRCYDTQLYTSVAFRTSRLPRGVPAQQDLVTALQQVACLATVDGAPAADTVLPDWLAEAGAAAARAAPGQWAAAEALRDALTRAGLGGAAVKRLAYGECVVLLPLGRGRRAALLPWWEGGRAANMERLVGGSIVAARVLEATGMRVVVAGRDLQQTVRTAATLMAVP